MAIQFHELPAEAFPKAAQPYIKRLNRELRELFALEGVLRQPIQAKRSDDTISRRAEVQVEISRITPSIMESVSGASSVIGVPALTLSTTNAVGTTNTVIAIDSTIALFGTAAPTGVSLTAAVGSSAFAARADHRHDHPVFTGGDLHEDLLPRSGVRDMTGTLGTDVGTFRSDVPSSVGASAFSLTDSVARAIGTEYFLSIFDDLSRAILRLNENAAPGIGRLIINNQSASTSASIQSNQWQFNNSAVDAGGTAEFQIGTGAGNRITFTSPSTTRSIRLAAGSSATGGIEIFSDDTNIANDHQIILRKQRADSTAMTDVVLIDHVAAFGDSRHIVAIKATGVTLSTVTQIGRWAVTGISFGLYKDANGRWQQVNGLPGGRLKFSDFGTTEPTT